MTTKHNTINHLVDDGASMCFMRCLSRCIVPRVIDYITSSAEGSSDNANAAEQPATLLGLSSARRLGASGGGKAGDGCAAAEASEPRPEAGLGGRAAGE